MVKARWCSQARYSEPAVHPNRSPIWQILVGSFDEMTHALEPGQPFQRRVLRCVAQGIGIALTILMPDDQPLLRQFTLPDRPDPAHG